jgi:hypothetical protein
MDEHFFKNRTSDETKQNYEPDTKKHQYNEIPSMTETKMSKPQRCEWLFNHENVVDYKYAPQDNTAKQNFYVQGLRYAHNAVHHKWLQQWKCDKLQILASQHVCNKNRTPEWA